MHVDSRRSLHFGVNFVFAPWGGLDGGSARRFEAALADDGLEFGHRFAPGDRFLAARESPPLQVQLLPVDGPPGIGQLVVHAPSPSQPLRHFQDDAATVVAAFERMWPGPRQVLQKDCTVRYLYSSTADHAFRYLWSERLGQPESDLQVFGRPIMGGGLRFVIPPEPGPPSRPQIEIKVESFLQDTRQIFVDVQFAWSGSLPPVFDAARTLDEVDRFANDEVVNFIQRRRAT